MIRFRTEWQDAPGARDAARTWCRLAIKAGGRLVTQAVHGPSESLRGLYGSAFPLYRHLPPRSEPELPS